MDDSDSDSDIDNIFYKNWIIIILYN
jgi:hypothetical protein